MPPKLMRQMSNSPPRNTRKRHRNNSGFIGRASPKSPAKSPHRSPAKRTRKNLHPNLTEENLENLHTVNLNAPEWRIHVGNNKSKEYIPVALRYLETKAPPPLKGFGKLPAFLTNKK